MKFRLGFLGAWALFVVGVGLAALVVAAEWANSKDAQRLRRLQRIDALIAARFGEKAEALRGSAEEREERLRQLRAQVTSTEVEIDESKDSDQTIIVSTAENRVFMRRGEEVLFQAICSTGKGTTLVEKGKKIVFETPTGRFRIVSKEESPVWIPPDWHFLEEARKKKLKLVRLTPRMAIDADTGAPVLEEHSEGIWSWFESSARPPAS